MNDIEKKQLEDEYVARLVRALGDVPADVRHEMVEDVRGHIEEAWAVAPTQDRATLLNIMARLGEPEDLAREQRERLSLTPPEKPAGPGLLPAAAVVLTALFWPVGLLLAWLSPRWSTRDKTVATLLPMLGIALVLLLSSPVGSGILSQAPQSPDAAVTSSANAVDPEGAGRVERRPSRAEAAATEEQVANRAIRAVPALRNWAPGIAAAAAGALVLYGLIGAPFTAAGYLGLRLNRGRRAAWLLAGVGLAVFAVCFVLVASLA